MSPSHPAPPASPGVVITVDADAAEAARAWSGALDRPVARIDGVERLATVAPGEPLAVVAPAAGPDIAWLTRVTELSVEADREVGVLAGTAAAARRHRRLGAHHSGAATGVAAYTHFWDVGEIPLVTDAVLCGPAGANRFLDQARRGAEALFVQAHGNGADMLVGERVLCAWKATGAVAGPGPALPCFAGGPCRRGAGPVAEPERFVDPAGWRADVIVLDTCWGLVPSDGLFAERATIAGAILAGPWARALLATTGVVRSRPDRFAATVARYLTGAPLGELALELNRTALEAGDADACWILYGDPAFAPAARVPVEPVPASDGGWRADGSAVAVLAGELQGDVPDRRELALVGAAGRGWQAALGTSRGRRGPPRRLGAIVDPRTGALDLAIVRAGHDAVAAARARKDWMRRAAGARAEQASLVRRCVASGLAPDPLGFAATLQAAALRLAERAGGGVERIDPPAERAQLERELQAAGHIDRTLAAHLCGVAAAVRDAHEHGATAARRPARECTACGGPMPGRRWRGAPFRGARRDVWSCGACGAFADVPAGVAPPLVRVAPGALEVEAPGLGAPADKLVRLRGTLWVGACRASRPPRGVRRVVLAASPHGDGAELPVPPGDERGFVVAVAVRASAYAVARVPVPTAPRSPAARG